MNSDTFNRFIDDLFTILDRLEKEYSAEDVIKEFKKELKKFYFTEGAFIWDLSAEEDKMLIRNTEKEIAFRKGKTEVIINVIKNALEKNLPIETIAVAVGLSIDEVKKIIKENNLDKPSE